MIQTYFFPQRYGITLEHPGPVEALPAAPDSGATAMSWVLTGLFAVFVVACLRYRKNSRYFSLMMHDVTEVRERHNAFDDTLRETSFVWLLNLLWCGAAGVLLYGYMFPPEPAMAFPQVDVARLGLCIGAAGVYTLFLTLAYSVVGRLFSDGPKASLWVKGFLSSQGLVSVGLFPVALLGLCVPSLMAAMVVAGVVMFLGAKCLFVYKGICIFFSQTASWVLFLYYLCSLEIVPIVLTYVGAGYLCESM